MPTNVGSQTVSIIYHASALSGNVNKRHKGIRRIGIYSGGYLSIVDSAPPCSVSLHPLICEITDGTHQVRVETTTIVSPISVTSATLYIILRWVYTGIVNNDYMEILAVASPQTNDVIVGKCSFTEAGILTGISYSERTTPNTLDLFLKVEPPDSSMTNKMKIRVRAGRIQTTSGEVKIGDQETNTPFSHSGGGSTEYGLVYIDALGSVQIVNANGNTSIPSFVGKLVLAIVAITSATTEISQSMITDVRSFLSRPIGVDDSTIEFDSTTGKLKVKNSGITYDKLGSVYDSGWFLCARRTTYTKTHNLGSQAILITLLFAPDSGGSPDLTNVFKVGLYVDDSNEHGANVQKITSNQLTIQSGYNCCGIDLKTTGNVSTHYASGHYRVLAIRVA